MIVQKSGDLEETRISNDTTFELDIPLMEISDSEVESEASFFILPSASEDTSPISTTRKMS